MTRFAARLVAVAAIFILPSVSVCSQTTSSPIIYRDRPVFYSQTRPGTIAFLPSSAQEGDAKYMTTFWSMEDSKCYELPRKGSYGFVANIRDMSNETPSYIAITIVQVLDSGSTSGAWTALQHSDHWLRENDPNFKPNPKLLKDSNVTLDGVKKWHLALPSMAAFDAALKGVTRRDFFWHGKPEDGLTTSWDDRFVLFGPASNTELPVLLPQWFSNLPPNYQTRTSTRLVRFTPTHKRVPDVPMDFYFNFCGATQAAIIASCPNDPDMDTVILLKLK